jgi:signal transduction histidine kinase
LIAQDTSQADRLKEFITLIISIILPLSAILALTMGLLLGRTLLARIDKINATAGKIAAGDLSQRVAINHNNDEFAELARHLNAMLSRIEQLITGMRQVTDNVAHDLRRPLSRLRNRLDVTLLEPRATEEYVDAIRQTIDDADELLKTFNALLEIAQTEAGSFRGEWTQIDLSTLAQTLGELYHDAAEESGIAFELHITPGIKVYGDYHLLAQVIRNLLENAIQHAAQSGTIRLSIDHLHDRPRLMVSDQGPGIHATQREAVLERFVRLDAARNTPGSGLGLSLVKAVAAVHQAQLLLEDNQPGLRVSLVFPADSA